MGGIVSEVEGAETFTQADRSSTKDEPTIGRCTLFFTILI
jgi:hypothetical protein